MSINLSHFGLAIDVPFIRPNARSFRPPSWPPPKDWVWIEDAEGNEVSRYGDHIANFTPWVGKTTTFAFGDGPKLHARSPVIDPANAELLRQLVAWRGWGPRGASAVGTLLANFAMPIRQIVQVCSKSKILASDLSRYPAVIDQVAHTLAPSTYEDVVAELERLRDARAFLGFELLDAAGIQRLKAAQPDHTPEQTEYIPPRIWNYVVNRVAECTQDYLAHRTQIEDCFAFCVDAYAANGVTEDREARGGRTRRQPFQSAPPGRCGRRSGITYHGPFVDTAQRFGIKEVLERWVGGVETIQAFTAYLSIVRYAALADIAAFTLMRIEEAASVRWNCLTWFKDPVFGRILLIEAETTKTDPDDEGRWITSPSVEPAIHVLQSIARLRLSCMGRWSEEANPGLLTASFEPWRGTKSSAKRAGVKPKIASLCEVVRIYPLLFDLEARTITQNDIKIARAVCPSLNAERFQVGKPWPLKWHQFRRTGAVNMFASGEISDSSIQLQMKHLTRWQPLYYGRGNTALQLNDAARVLLVNAQYEAMGRQLAEVHTDRFVSPYGDEHKAKLLAPANGGEPVSLISEGHAQRYEKAARNHQMSFRLTVLGACMKNGQCDGDCVSSVGDCAGGDGHPCSNVLFDRSRADANQKRLGGVIKQLEITPPDTPRYRFLEAEKRGLENYFAYIRQAA
ncbi:hypothetical protein [Aromatoleum evansii]|uniref:hypothetical protein n=1 Tax=Aromatoleum evansii TaxID=59406 RepID=UPI00145F7374|nr:hypothetical protein [Aromatoleum evansii]NMG29520.1 hypothetical protein [Aromatoleum evansii]